jgi:hypothetical protein
MTGLPAGIAAASCGLNWTLRDDNYVCNNVDEKTRRDLRLGSSRANQPPPTIRRTDSKTLQRANDDEREL